MTLEGPSSPSIGRCITFQLLSFTHSFILCIRVFHKYLLSAYSVLGTGDAKPDKMGARYLTTGSFHSGWKDKLSGLGRAYGEGTGTQARVRAAVCSNPGRLLREADTQRLLGSEELEEGVTARGDTGWGVMETLE